MWRKPRTADRTLSKPPLPASPPEALTPLGKFLSWRPRSPVDSRACGIPRAEERSHTHTHTTDRTPLSWTLNACLVREAAKREEYRTEAFAPVQKTWSDVHEAIILTLMELSKFNSG